ncbi:MAG: glycosyltransferase [Microbacterium sp.]
MTTAAPSSPAPNDRPLTILIAADTWRPDINGAVSFTERLAEGLVERGHDVHIAAPNTTHRFEAPRQEKVGSRYATVHRLPSQKLWWHEWLRFVWPWRSKHYARIVLDRVKPDIVHSQSHIVIGRGMTRIARTLGIPVIATNHVMADNIIDHTTLPGPLNAIFMKLAWDDAKRTLDMAAVVTTPTPRAAEYLERTIDIAGVVPISCGLRTSDYTADLTPRAQKKVVFVGRLTTEKSVDVVLRAIAKLAPEIDVSFDVVGDGDQRTVLADLTAELGITDRVRFHGRATDEQLRRVLTEASVFAIASVAELQSIAALEAMASGLPIVAADAVALPHLVTNGENGYLFTPGDADGLADKLRKVLTASDDDYLRLQQASLARVATHDIEHTLDTFEALYRGERP